MRTEAPAPLPPATPGACEEAAADSALPGPLTEGEDAPAPLPPPPPPPPEPGAPSPAAAACGPFALPRLPCRGGGTGAFVTPLVPLVREPSSSAAAAAAVAAAAADSKLGGGAAAAA